MTLAQTINGRMAALDMRKPELAAALCMASRTLYSRLENPDAFTVGELRRAARKLKMPITLTITKEGVSVEG